jgi:hypothetical protein
LKTSQNGGQNGGNHDDFQKNTSNGAYCTNCCQPGHIKSNCFRLKNKFNSNSVTSNNDSQGHSIFHSNDVALTTIAIFHGNCGFLIVEKVVTTANPQKG